MKRLICQKTLERYTKIKPFVNGIYREILRFMVLEKNMPRWLAEFLGRLLIVGGVILLFKVIF